MCEVFVTGLNHAFVIGANAMIGIALAAIAYGMSAWPRMLQRATTTASTDPRRAADREAAERLLEREPSFMPELALVALERRPDRRWRREEEALHAEPLDDALPDPDERDEDDERREPVTGAAADHTGDPATRQRLHGDRRGAHAAPSERPVTASGASSPPPRCRASRTSSRARRSADPHGSRAARPRQVDRDHLRDAPRPRRHHDDARREEDRFGDRVRDEDDRRAAGLPDAQELDVESLARHLVERAERLVHEQERGIEGERARDRDALLHAAGELPRWCSREALKLDELEHLVDPLLPALLVPARELERQGDVLRDRAPLVEHCILEDDPVVVVAAGLPRGLAVDGRAAARRLDQVADDAQQRRLAAAGRADQRDELARLDLEIDVLERDGAAAA